MSSGCRMNVDGLSFPEVDPSCAVAREDELDATAMWILEVGRRVRRVRWDGRRAAEADVRGTCACFGEGGSSAVHWGSTANPIVATCTAGLKGQAWCALPGGCGPVSRETSSESPKDRSRSDSDGGSSANARRGSYWRAGTGCSGPFPGGATGPLPSDEYDVGSHARSDAKNRSP